MTTKGSTKGITERYQLRHVIGAGGSGEVVAAWDTQLARLVAIKRLRSDHVTEEQVQQAHQEALRLAALHHPNIVSVYDMGVHERCPYIVMEHLQGESIEDRSLREVLSADEFFSFAVQSLEGLYAAHKIGMIHRDLKPANLFLLKQPSGSHHVKILDFGISKFISEPTKQTTALDDTITGSIHCVSPEQLNRKPVDARADLYSMGCVYYYSLTGIYPFSGNHSAEIIAAHLSHNVVDLHQLRPDLPQLVCQWVMSLLNVSPDDRYDGALEALGAIKGIARAAGAVAISPGSAPRNPQTTAAIRLTTPKPVASMDRPQEVKSQNGLITVLASALAAGLVCTLAAWFISSRLPVSAPVPTAPTEAAAPTLAAASQPALQTPTPVVPLGQQAPPAALVDPDSVPAILPEPMESEVPSPPPAQVVLQITGSNTVGAALAPSLAAAFLKDQGGKDIERINLAPEESAVDATMPDGRVRICISAHGSSTSFSALVAGKTDIGMSSRPVKTEEVTNALAVGLGDLRSRANEHVVGLDGVAVFVHPASTISQLSVKQVHDIFTGKIGDWKDVGGVPGPITLYARDDKSGTFDTFKSLVLDKDPLDHQARRYEDSNALSDGVAADLQGIGFAGLPYIRNTKPLAIFDTAGSPFMPTRFTVATEDYPLSRRLFLYTSANPSNTWVRKLIDFAVSDAGQKVVREVGFVEQAVEPVVPNIAPDAPETFRLFVEGALRLNLTLRFRPGSADLDNKALRDMDRIMNAAGERVVAGGELLLLGFSDSTGNDAANLTLSKERAEMIAKELAMRGIVAAKPQGFGPILPVASNESTAGRERNRRVEVWIR